MHKKLAALIVALSMTSAALAGCGAAQQAAAPALMPQRKAQLKQLKARLRRQ